MKKSSANTTSKANLIFFGNCRLAQGLNTIELSPLQQLLAAGYTVSAIVHRKGDTDLEIEEFAKENSINLLDYDKLSPSTIEKYKSEIAILASFGSFVPNTVIKLFRLGIINIHPSLLPHYRGPTPIEQAILDGAPKTGVSLMQLSQAMDEGPLFTYKTLHLNGRESKQYLAQKLLDLGAELIIQNLPKILDGSLIPKAQPHPDRATYSRKLTKSDGKVDWSKPAVQIEREVRAYLGWPGSQANIGGKDVIITKAEIGNQELVSSKKLGESFLLNNGELAVQTASEPLIIKGIKPAGKSEMSGSDFTRGYLKNK